LYLLLGFSSAALALFLTPVVGRGSTLLGLVDAPGGRKVHTQSVPRLGGLAVVTAASLSIVLVHTFLSGRGQPPIWPSLQPLVFGGSLIFLAGLVDDVCGLGPVAKLAIEFLAAGVVMSSGLLI